MVFVSALRHSTEVQLCMDRVDSMVDEILAELGVLPDERPPAPAVLPGLVVPAPAPVENWRADFLDVFAFNSVRLNAALACRRAWSPGPLASPGGAAHEDVGAWGLFCKVHGHGVDGSPTDSG